MEQPTAFAHPDDVWPEAVSTNGTDSGGSLCYMCEEELEDWMKLTFKDRKADPRFCSIACLLTWCADEVQKLEER
ncbi:hypothetical protein LCGC14_2396830 [marine sediment metagenome]|uniref:Uncharacterized protein n=1 Tax=marine sediment metagenome TaxID=412755 RepID=A0A0F9BWJ7_9ZZZZ